MRSILGGSPRIRGMVLRGSRGGMLFLDLHLARRVYPGRLARALVGLHGCAVVCIWRGLGRGICHGRVRTPFLDLRATLERMLSGESDAGHEQYCRSECTDLCHCLSPFWWGAPLSSRQLCPFEGIPPSSFQSCKENAREKKKSFGRLYISSPLSLPVLTLPLTWLLNIPPRW